MSNKYNYVNKKHINWINLSFAKELAIKNTSNCCKIAKQSVTTLARYSQYISYGEICSTEHGYLQARRLGRRAVLDVLTSELDMLDSEQSEQGSTY